jgi:DNA (cytosine-5)-methyltransferase 1
MPEYPNALEGRVTVRQAIADLPDADQFDDLRSIDSVRVEWITESMYARRLRGMEVDNADFSYTRTFDPNVLTCSLITEHTELSKARFLATRPGQTEKISRFLRLDPEGLCNTLRAGTDSARGAHTSPRPIHPIYPRVLTVREAARLHSYPDWFRMHVTKWHGFRQIGNSVPPLLGRAVASAIMFALGETAAKPEESMELGDKSLLSMNMGEAAKYFSVSRHVIAQRNRKSVDKNPVEPTLEVAEEEIEVLFELTPS